MSDDETEKFKVAISSSAGGTTSPSPGTYYRDLGYAMYLSAKPDTGYVFDRWSDGGAQSHQIIVNKDYDLTAYFKVKPKDSYTLSLSASPSGAGTVSGGGTYEEGELVVIEAFPNSGYRFLRWSNGGSQRQTVTVNYNMSLTAFFERYTASSGEIFLGTDMNDGTYWKAYGQASGTLLSTGVYMAIFDGDLSGTSYISFNVGSLYGKIRKGKKYRLTMTAQAFADGRAIVASFADADKGNMVTNQLSSEPVFYGGTNGSTSTAEKEYVSDFTAIRDATYQTGFLFSITQSCMLLIKSISLKEM